MFKKIVYIGVMLVLGLGLLSCNNELAAKPNQDIKDTSVINTPSESLTPRKTINKDEDSNSASKPEIKDPILKDLLNKLGDKKFNISTGWYKGIVNEISNDVVVTHTYVAEIDMYGCVRNLKMEVQTYNATDKRIRLVESYYCKDNVLYMISKNGYDREDISNVKVSGENEFGKIHLQFYNDHDLHTYTYPDSSYEIYDDYAILTRKEDVTYLNETYFYLLKVEYTDNEQTSLISTYSIAETGFVRTIQIDKIEPQNIEIPEHEYVDAYLRSSFTSCLFL